MKDGSGVSLGELAELVGGRADGDPHVRVHRVATLEKATQGSIAFLANARYRGYLNSTGASAVILGEADAARTTRPALVHDNPYLAYALVSQRLHRQPPPSAGVDAGATVAGNVTLGEGVHVGSGAIIEADVVVGPGTVIGPGCVIAAGARIGRNGLLSANVTLGRDCILGDRVILQPGVVIGSDGFGFAFDGNRWVKVPQTGRVVIGDDVEVGANTTVDRGALEDTVIENGVKIDNLVQIAHNVHIGEHSIVAGCVGIAGSARIGRRCTLAGNVGVNGHISIADDTVVTARSWVTHDIREPGMYSSGTPMSTNQQWRRNAARFNQLDDMARRLRRLEKAVTGQTKARNPQDSE